MDELLEQFLIEGRDLVEEAQTGLARMALDPQDATAIDGLFRAVHTLKGSVGLFDMAPAERLLHAAEDMLDRARNHVDPLDPHIIAALVECLDQIDRWIDQLEQRGRLDDTAAQTSAALLERLSARDDVPAAGAGSESTAWLAALVDRAGTTLDTAAPQTGFRYIPDRDCFFRGEDPLAIAGAVPELLTLSVAPTDEEWPPLAAFEPFNCICVIEGLSAAPLDLVQAAFRMVPGQVVVIAVNGADPAAGAEANAGSVPAATMLRVEAGRIEALADGLGELIVATKALSSIALSADEIDRNLAARLRAAQAQIDDKIAGLHRTVSSVRMVSLAPSLRRLPRMVREIAVQLGKAVRLRLNGEAVEVDKQIADGLFEPLLHLIRNALDHGIEGSEQRVAAGKPAEGMLKLDVAREGDAILVSLSDDGAGIDPDELRRVAIARGLCTPAAADAMTDAAATRLIFEAGFSTAATVTGVSGRGVGMDVVLAAVERLRGSIEIDSAPGNGTRFLLRLPANAITTRLLVIDVDGDRYGVALDQIVETLRVERNKLIPLGAGTALVLRGRVIPVLSLATLLGTTDRPAAVAKLLITRSAGEAVAVRVDGIAERIDTLVRAPSRFLASVPGVTGTTLTGEGDVLLILDLPGLLV